MRGERSKALFLMVFVLVLVGLIVSTQNFTIDFRSLTGFAVYIGESTNFDNGTYDNTTLVSSQIRLSGNNLTGTFISESFGQGSEIRWNNITWSTASIYGVQLPNNKGNDGQIDMAQNTLLLRLDNYSNINDDSGSNHYVSVNGSLSNTEGIYDQGIVINADEYLRVEHTSNLSLDDDYSIEFWIKLSNNAAAWKKMMEKPNQFSIELINNDKLRVQPNGYSNLDSNTPLTKENWTHIIVTLDNTAGGNDYLRIYLNGNLDKSLGPVWGTPGTGTNNLTIGGAGGGNYVEGVYDEIAIYNGRVLDAGEVLERYKRGILRMEAEVRNCTTTCTSESWQNLGGESPKELNLQGKYLQTKFLFTTQNSTYTPALNNFTINYDILNYPPQITIVSPANGSAYNINQNISLNYLLQDAENNISACWYNLDAGTNTTLVNCGNTTISIGTQGLHRITLFSNDTQGNTGAANVTIEITNGKPIINIIEPLDGNTYNGSQEINLTYTVYDIDGNLESCWYNINQGINNSLGSCNNASFTIADGEYILTIFANDTNGSESSKETNFNSDAEGVTVSITEPTGTKRSRTNIPLEYTTTGENKTCWYNIKTSIGGVIIANTTIASCANTTFNVSNDGDYVASIFVNNTFGTSSFDSNSFSVDTSTGGEEEPTTGSSGGGGGGGGSTASSSTTRLEVEPISVIMAIGEEKKLQAKVKNLGIIAANKCKMETTEEYNGAIEADQITNIAAGEIVEFDFILKALNQNVENASLKIVCLDSVEKGVDLKIKLVKSKLGISIYKMDFIEGPAILVNYSIQSLSPSTEKIIFKLLDEDENSFFEKEEELKLVKGDNYNTVTLSLEDSPTGILKVSVEDKDELVLIEETIIYDGSTSFTGRAITDNAAVSYIGITILVFLVIGFFIVRRIWRLKKGHSS